MPHPLEKSLHALRVSRPETTSDAARARRDPGEAPPDPSSPEGAVAELAGWLEPRHTLLLRTLLDRTDSVRAAPAPAVAQGVLRIMDGLRRDTRLKYAELRERWDVRLAPPALLPFLERNQWIVPHPDGGVTLTGKGGRKEARMLYLQTGHDMATDCARQWASVAGRLQAFQASIAAEWHAAVIAADDETRLLPTLEAALRDAELDAWKTMRLSLGDVAEEAFIRATLRWETRSFADPEDLVRGLLAPWAGAGPGRNGWTGFMRALARTGERMTLAMLAHYERKWTLYLRGLPVAARPDDDTTTKDTER